MKVVIYQNTRSSDLAGFLTHARIHIKIFAPFKQILSLAFSCITAALCDIFFLFSVWFFEMELNPLLDLLLEYRIYNILIQISCFKTSAELCTINTLANAGNKPDEDW